MDTPLQLTSPEATGLLVALRALADIPGVVDPEAARSAIAKIETAAGAAGHGNDVSAVDEPAPAESQAAAAVRAAVRDNRALTIDYYSASHDTLSTRIVDPIRIVLVGGHSYLEAWSREAEGVRLFRFDRIVDASVLDEPSAPPEPAMQAPPDTSLFDADPSLPSATLRLSPAASWMFEYYPMRLLRELPDGYCEAAMTYASEDWMARLRCWAWGRPCACSDPQSLAARVPATRQPRWTAYQAVARSADQTAAAVASWGHLEVDKVDALHPWHLAIIAVLVIVLFGAKKLPDAARSLGKSMRIFKSEVREMQTDGKPETSRHPSRTGQPVQSERVEPPAADGRSA